MKFQNPKVFVKYNGEEVAKARLYSCGPKVEFQPGEVCLADYKKAQSLVGHYKRFEIVDVAELTAEEIANAQENDKPYAKKITEVEEDKKVKKDKKEKKGKGKKAEKSEDEGKAAGDIEEEDEGKEEEGQE